MNIKDKLMKTNDFKFDPKIHAQTVGDLPPEKVKEILLKIKEKLDCTIQESTSVKK